MHAELARPKERNKEKMCDYNDPYVLHKPIYASRITLVDDGFRVTNFTRFSVFKLLEQFYPGASKIKNDNYQEIYDQPWTD